MVLIRIHFESGGASTNLVPNRWRKNLYLWCCWLWSGTGDNGSDLPCPGSEWSWFYRYSESEDNGDVTGQVNRVLCGYAIDNWYVVIILENSYICIAVYNVMYYIYRNISIYIYIMSVMCFYITFYIKYIIECIIHIRYISWMKWVM